MYSFPSAVAFQYSSSGVGTGAPFCISHRPGDWAATVANAIVMMAAHAPPRRPARILLGSFARGRAKLLAGRPPDDGSRIAEIGLITTKDTINDYIIARF